MNCVKTIIFFLISVSLSGQGLNFNKGKSTKKNYYTEITYKEIRGKIIIPVNIEGKTYQFLLDTGAPNLITSDLSNRIYSKHLKEIKVNDANNKSKKLKVVSIPLFTIGEVSFKNTPTIVNNKDSNFIFDCFKVEGIIGSNMLRNSIIQILPKKKLIKLSNSKEYIAYNEGHALDLTLKGRQSSPYIWIDLAGKDKGKEHVLLDTGMKGFYDLSKKNYNVFKKKRIFLKISEGVGVNSMGLFGPSDKSNIYRLLTPELKINKGLFKNVIVTTTSSKNSRIGTEILEYGSIILDFKNKKFAFSPFQEDTVDLNKKLLGMDPIILDNKIVIGIVWDEELKSKIHFGDEIISVNGEKYVDIDICDVITKESIFEVRDSMDFELKNAEGSIERVTLTKVFPVVHK